LAAGLLKYENDNPGVTDMCQPQDKKLVNRKRVTFSLWPLELIHVVGHDFHDLLFVRF